MRKIYAVVIMTALLLMVNGCSESSTGGGDNQIGNEVGQIAPDFTYTDFDGNSVSLSDYRGKVILLFFFGNQCPPCYESGIKTENEINDVFPHDSFQALGLDQWDSSSNTSTLTNFLQLTGITYPVLRQAGQAGDEYNITYDRIMVLDKNGVIVFKGTTVASFEIGEAATVIGNLLAE